jgi:hypothetical protein
VSLQGSKNIGRFGLLKISASEEQTFISTSELLPKSWVGGERNQ